MPLLSSMVPSPSIPTSPPWFTLQMRDLSATSNPAHSSLTTICAIVGGTSLGVVIVVIGLISWKRRCWTQRARHARQGEHPHRSVLVKREKKSSITSPEKLASSTSSSRTSSNAVTSEKAQLAGVLPPANAVPHDKVETVRSATTIKQTPSFVKPTAIHLRPPKLRSSAGGDIRPPLTDHLNRGLSYKASTITSSSVYSTQSGEERQVRVPPSVILAALGPSLGPVNEHGLTVPHQRTPDGSVRPPTSFKAPDEAGLALESNRLSHISAGSLQLNTQVVDHASPEPIGLAYGGEEQGS
ncbi:hypothetical protein V8B97DRAFT_2093078 [Scleroderma yunnanense]